MYEVTLEAPSAAGEYEVLVGAVDADAAEEGGASAFLAPAGVVYFT